MGTEEETVRKRMTAMWARYVSRSRGGFISCQRGAAQPGKLALAMGSG